MINYYDYYTHDEDSDAAFMELLSYQCSLTPNQALQKNRRRSLSDSNLGIYAAFCELYTSPGQKERRRRSSILPANTSPAQPVERVIPQPNSAQIAATIQYGLLNLIRPSFDNAPQRQEELAHTVRLNMINLYLKFIVQALLYGLAAILVLTIVTLCTKFLSVLLPPITLICALHMAARAMHQPHNQLHAPNAYQARSLVENLNWGNTLHGLIDRTSNYSVGFFSGFATFLANSSLLDRQIAHVPDNSQSILVANEFSVF